MTMLTVEETVEVFPFCGPRFGKKVRFFARVAEFQIEARDDEFHIRSLAVRSKRGIPQIVAVLQGEDAAETFLRDNV